MGKTANPKEMTPQMEGQVFYVELFFIVIFFSAWGYLQYSFITAELYIVSHCYLGF